VSPGIDGREAGNRPTTLRPAGQPAGTPAG